MKLLLHVLLSAAFLISGRVNTTEIPLRDNVSEHQYDYVIVGGGTVGRKLGML